MTSAVVDEAIKKAAIAWVAVAGGPSLGLWCMPLDGALVIVCGPGEQNAPGLAEAATASVRLRGDTGGLIVIWEATVERLQPGTEEWMGFFRDSEGNLVGCASRHAAAT